MGFTILLWVDLSWHLASRPSGITEQELETAYLAVWANALWV
jgi:hypothetical protein